MGGDEGNTASCATETGSSTRRTKGSPSTFNSISVQNPLTMNSNPLEVEHGTAATNTATMPVDSINEPPTKKQKVEVGTASNDASVVTSSSTNTDGTSSSSCSTSQQSTASTTAASSHESLQEVVATSPPPATATAAGAADPGNRTPQQQLKQPPTAKEPPASVAASSTPAAAAAGPSSSAGSALSPSQADSSASSSAAAPLKALTFAHLRTKYVPELEYMLREFRKLERQLLGAKSAKLEESAGSRERREKLHSFILHLDDTVRQIELGCKLEAEGKHPITVTLGETKDPAASSSTAAAPAGTPDDSATQQLQQQKDRAEANALVNMSAEKEGEENVQKIEEHILANLLPVKVRLKKQLAAQQGATQNPAGMPALRRGSLQPPSAAKGKGTFAEAAEKRRQQAEAARLAAQEQRERAERRLSDPTQFGKPLSGGGSALTKNLHGSTLGSSQRTHGHGVGSSSKPDAETSTEGKPTAQRKILYAGMVPQSTQQESGLSAASGVHDVVTTGSLGSSVDSSSAFLVADPSPLREPRTPEALPPLTDAHNDKTSKPSSKAAQPTQHHDHQMLCSTTPLTAEDSMLRLRKKRRKRKLLRLARRRERERNRQHAVSMLCQPSGGALPAPKTSAMHSKVAPSLKGPKKGPKSVEYICSLCSETYATTNDYNPWWALSQHECPKCRKTQIPRIDINAPANAIEYHPALLAHLEDNGGRSSKGSNSKASAAVSTEPSSSVALPYPTTSILDESDSDTDLSELSDDDMSIDSAMSDTDTWPVPDVTPAERAELEHFGSEYRGPLFLDDHAAKLLVLMSHASTCPCKHESKEHRDVCRSVKYMMLHVRDCPGTTANNDVCPFPWCRKVKHLLYHLVNCPDPEQSPILSPKDLPENLKALSGLNRKRAVLHRKFLIEAQNAATVCKPVAPRADPPPSRTPAPNQLAGATQLGTPPEESGATALSGSMVPNQQVSQSAATTSSQSADESGTLGATKASDEQLAQAALAAAATVDTAEMEQDPSTQAALAVAASTKLIAARPVNLPASNPLENEGAATMSTEGTNPVIKKEDLDDLDQNHAPTITDVQPLSSTTDTDIALQDNMPSGATAAPSLATGNVEDPSSPSANEKTEMVVPVKEEVTENSSDTNTNSAATEAAALSTAVESSGGSLPRTSSTVKVN